ncbi:MAG: sigma factor-like helix-turn-helix DNA-binding protein [Marinoscillum sp.]
MSFNTIWSKYETHLFNFTREKVDSVESAQDILQEVAVKFSTALKNGSIEKHESWLFQVTRNTIADYYRREFKKPATQADFPVAEAYDPCVCDLAGFVIQHYLPAKYGQPLFMADIEKIPQKEVAERLNISLTATKSRIQRARKMLKDRLEDCVAITYRANGSISDFHLKSGCVLPPELLQEMEKLKLSF